MDREVLVPIAGLSPVERRVLESGIQRWQQSYVTVGDDAARFIGYADAEDLQRHIGSLATAIGSEDAVTRRDLQRALTATELAFANETSATGRRWFYDTGFTDRDTITLLRNIQEKVAGIVRGASDTLDELAVPYEPAWQRIPFDAAEDYWSPFAERFRFRPGTDPAQWPAITEPVPAVTLDLAPAFDSANHSEFMAWLNAVNATGLLAMTRAFGTDIRMIVLDWQHPSYYFWPHRQARRKDPEWPIDIFPEGDYYIFLTEEMSCGTFGHPWEQTLCVFGEPLVEHLVPLLTGWLPVKRSTL